MRKARVGVRLRRFREEQGLTQAALADALGISPSYVNQMESNQRPITVPVLLKLSSVFDVDLQQFSTEEADRLTAQLSDVFADASFGERITGAESRELASAMPSIARFVVELHRRHRYAQDVNTSIGARVGAGHDGVEAAAPPTAYEEVRDLFYAHRNHFDDLDRAAEEIGGDVVDVDHLVAVLTERLASRHGVTVRSVGDADDRDTKRHFDPAAGVLELAAGLDTGQRAFQLATHLALVELGGLIDGVVDRAGLSSDETRELARIGLANYVAGAVILPYGRFLAAAEELRYDIELLEQRFRVGFETIAHRLSTLQRHGARGVPFFLVRVDRAGNISKRQSATDFHFSRVGGSCPLWNVYEAFARPGEVVTQLAQMPDGRSYLWIARTVQRRTGGYGTPAKTFAIGLGCDLHHAARVVYSDGLDLTNPAVRTPIGPGCKLCDRPNCPQRAFPALGEPLQVDPNHSGYLPYRRSLES
jgi:hypothetical protein